MALAGRRVRRSYREVAEGNAMIDEAAVEAGRDPRAIRRLYDSPETFGPTRRGYLQGPPEQWVDELLPLAIERGVTGFTLVSDDPARDRALRPRGGAGAPRGLGARARPGRQRVRRAGACSTDWARCNRLGGEYLIVNVPLHAPLPVAGRAINGETRLGPRATACNWTLCAEREMPAIGYSYTLWERGANHHGAPTAPDARRSSGSLGK
jgi:hypothetical protein